MNKIKFFMGIFLNPTVMLFTLIYMTLIVAFPGTILTASATNHLVHISEVMAGANGDPSVQFVELRMLASNQNFFTQNGQACVQLEFFDGDNVSQGTFDLAHNPPNSGGQHVLIATSATASQPGAVAPDFFFDPSLHGGVQPISGKVCYQHVTPRPAGCFGAGACVSYGSNTSASIRTQAHLPIEGARSLQVGTAAIVSGDGQNNPTNNLGEGFRIDATTRTLVDVVVTTAAKRVLVNSTQHFTATAIFNDGHTEDVTASTTWRSSDDTVATVDTHGMVMAVGLGTTTIEGTFQHLVGNAVLEVVPRVAAALHICPQAFLNCDPDADPLSSHVSLTVGRSNQFQALAHLSDGTIEEVTSDVDWAGDGDAVVFVSQEGLVAAQDLGTATVTATLDGVESNAAIVEVVNPRLTGHIGFDGDLRPDRGYELTMHIQLFASPADVEGDSPLFDTVVTTTRVAQTRMAGFEVPLHPAHLQTHRDIAIRLPQHSLTSVLRDVEIGSSGADIFVNVVMGDLDQDGDIDQDDLQQLTAAFGTATTAETDAADLDRDGRVGISDFGILSRNLGRHSPIELFE